MEGDIVEHFHRNGKQFGIGIVMDKKPHHNDGKPCENYFYLIYWTQTQIEYWYNKEDLIFLKEQNNYAIHNKKQNCFERRDNCCFKI